MDQLPRLGKRELIRLLLFTCNYVVFVWRGFLFLWVLGMGYVILLWHSLSLPYNYFGGYKTLGHNHARLFTHSLTLTLTHLFQIFVKRLDYLTEMVVEVSELMSYGPCYDLWVKTQQSPNYGK